MKTLSKNELSVVNILLKDEGEMKRNSLERQTGLAKSSLSTTLNALERKNVVQVNRLGAVHYVSFTEWFKGL